MYTARPELGIKRLCVSCAVRFYDLGRAPALCPACGTEQPPPRPRSAPLPRGTSWARRPGPAAAPAPEAAEDEAIPLLDAADPEEDAEDDDEDIAEIAPATEEEPL
jgi:uncharacterized protein (TIGR02300 family)